MTRIAPRRLAAVAALLLAGLSLGGCIIVPGPHYHPYRYGYY